MPELYYTHIENGQLICTRKTCDRVFRAFLLNENSVPQVFLSGYFLKSFSVYNSCLCNGKCSNHILDACSKVTSPKFIVR